ncbi:hypothetical protein [Nocardioides rubriscoriae]|uniref:hypothetical protein n=1 Tax=Nocardioides rubriscoriae TaxID=642762 RepID=UPI0011DFED16|nr:hypothetical protein [Nocardioides rubriscoriae]
MKRTLALSAAALLLPLVLTGCGGGDTDAEDTAPADRAGSSESAAPETDAAETAGPTKDEFVTRANEVCAAGNGELATAGADVDPQDPDAVAAFATDVLVPNVRGQLEDIRALGFPEDDAELLDSTLTDASTALDEIEADPTLLTGDENPFAEVNTALTDYGLTECAS